MEDLFAGRWFPSSARGCGWAGGMEVRRLGTETLDHRRTSPSRNRCHQPGAHRRDLALEAVRVRLVRLGRRSSLQTWGKGRVCAVCGRMVAPTSVRPCAEVERDPCADWFDD